MTVKFNANNEGYKDSNYPLYLGDPLGVADTINVPYPKLEELYLTQESQIWNEFKVDLTQDRSDMLNASKGVVDLMVKTLMWQTVGDTVASRSIIEVLGKYVSNTQLEQLLTIWAFFEVIHARTYSHIIKQTFQIPNEILEEIYKDHDVLKRSDIIVQTFEDLSNLSDDADEETVRTHILRVHVALLSLECIAFMASFATTFGIAETGIFQGICKDVTYICKDECLHGRMGLEIIQTLLKDPVWVTTFKNDSVFIKNLLDAIVKQELDWCDYAFSEGRGVLGLSSSLLKEYVLHMAYPIYSVLDIEFDFEVIKNNPLKYMDKYINGALIQVASQELQLTSYKKGASVDNTDSLDLSMMGLSLS